MKKLRRKGKSKSVGEKKSPATQKESIAILETWFNANIADPYLCGEQKEDPVAYIVSFIKPKRKGKKKRVKTTSPSALTCPHCTRKFSCKKRLDCHIGE